MTQLTKEIVSNFENCRVDDYDANMEDYGRYQIIRSFFLPLLKGDLKKKKQLMKREEILSKDLQFFDALELKIKSYNIKLI